MKIVQSIGELERLGRDRRANGLFSRAPVAVRIAGLSYDQHVLIEQALNRFQTRCGCVEGALCLMAGLVGGGVLIALSEPQIFSLGFAGQVIGVVFGAFWFGFVGKMAAMAATRISFARAARALARKFSASEFSQAQVTAAGA